MTPHPKTQAKICGLGTAEAVDAAIAGGAAYAGFVFYPPSPRHIAPATAAALAARLPGHMKSVAVLVDPTDDALAALLAAFRPDFLQLHGHESPERTAAVKQKTGLGVIKAVPVASAADLDRAQDYSGVADMVLLDAKAPEGMDGALPGGNGLRFDWDLIAQAPTLPPLWILSGGLDAGNVSEAISVTRAALVDVSSGVEDRPGVKSPVKIKAFLAAVAAV
jgi:phosphoribosylanthranilate isomerase